MSKKFSFDDKKRYHTDRLYFSHNFDLDENSSKCAYSDGWLDGAYGATQKEVRLGVLHWRNKGRAQSSSYSLGVAAGKKARRRG